MTEQILNHENRIQHVKREPPKDVSSHVATSESQTPTARGSHVLDAATGSAYLSNFARFRLINHPLSLRFLRFLKECLNAKRL